MDNNLKLAIDRLKESKEILKQFKTKEEAVEYLIKETGISKEECSSAYDILIKLDVELKNIENELVKALNKKNKIQLKPENLKISEEFHNRYYDEMYDKKVKVILKDGTEIVGLYNDEFYDDCSIFVNYEFVKIPDIETMELVEE